MQVSCVGCHACVLEVVEGETSTVHAFADSMKPFKNIETVNVAFAYDTGDGHTFILRVNHCLDFTKDMEHSILCTNQSRAHNIIIDDVPKTFDYTNTSSQSLHHRESGHELPILFCGPIPYLPICTLTPQELDECIHIHLTSPERWDVNLYPRFSDDPTPFQGVNSIERAWDDLDIIINSLSVSGFNSRTSKSTTPESLARLWRIDLPTAKRTMEATTQGHIQVPSTDLIDRQYKTRVHQKQYCQLGGYLGQFSSDIFTSNTTSIRGNNYFTLFANRCNFVSGSAMDKKSKAPDALDRFLHEVGIPTELTTDGGKELNLGRWGELCQRYTIPQKLTESYSLWQNYTEHAGGIIKQKVCHLMRQTNTFLRLWDYCWEYVLPIPIFP